MRDLGILVAWPEGSTFFYLGFVSSLLLFFTILRKNKCSAAAASNNTDDDDEQASYPPVEPLSDFDWKTKEPVKIRPFKPKYHLTMSMCTFPTERELASDAHRYPGCNRQRAHRNGQDLS